MKRFFTRLCLLCVCSVASVAQASDSAEWFLNIDLNALRHSSVGPLITERHAEGVQMIDAVLGPELHAQIDQLSMYGQGHDKQSFTFMLQGDFSDRAMADFLQPPGVEMTTEALDHNGQTIQLWFIDENLRLKQYPQTEMQHDNPVTLYAAAVNPRLLVLSHNLSDVKAWLDGEEPMPLAAQEGLFNMVVNIDESLAHGAVKTHAVGDSFKSNVLKKVSQFSFSVFESAARMNLEIGLAASSADSAAQVRDIINGLIALNNMSDVNDKNPLHKALMDNLTVQLRDDQVLLSSAVDVALLQAHLNTHATLHGH